MPKGFRMPNGGRGGCGGRSRSVYEHTNTNSEFDGNSCNVQQPMVQQPQQRGGGGGRGGGRGQPVYGRGDVGGGRGQSVYGYGDAGGGRGQSVYGRGDATTNPFMYGGNVQQEQPMMVQEPPQRGGRGGRYDQYAKLRGGRGGGVSTTPVKPPVERIDGRERCEQWVATDGMGQQQQMPVIVEHPQQQEDPLPMPIDDVRDATSPCQHNSDTVMDQISCNNNQQVAMNKIMERGQMVVNKIAGGEPANTSAMGCPACVLQDTHKRALDEALQQLVRICEYYSVQMHKVMHNHNP